MFGGDRTGEFEQWLAGATYEEIARAGGSIASTVRASTVQATRAAGEADLVAGALPRPDCLIAEGVTTVEVKSGHGLNLAAEARMLHAARRFGQEHPVPVTTTLLGAHALPPGMSDKQAYIDEVCSATLPTARRESLAGAVDACCKGIAFSPSQVAQVFAATRAAGLPVKLHANQRSNGGGARFAAGHGVLSADYLEPHAERKTCP